MKASFRATAYKRPVALQPCATPSCEAASTPVSSGHAEGSQHRSSQRTHRRADLDARTDQATRKDRLEHILGQHTKFQAQQPAQKAPVSTAAPSLTSSPQYVLFQRILSQGTAQLAQQKWRLDSAHDTGFHDQLRSSAPAGTHAAADDAPSPHRLAAPSASTPPAPPAAATLPVEPPAPPTSATLPAEPTSSDTRRSETCVITHPGSMCCSTVEVTREDSSKTVQISLVATIRLTNAVSPAVRDMNDLELIGLLAAAQQLQDRAMVLNAGQVYTKPLATRHEQVMHTLGIGRVISAEKRENGFGHITYKCVLQEPDTQRRMNAFFKPAVEGNCEGWHRADMEAVAYQLNRLLGMDYVPPCVFRATADVDWQHFERGGVFMYWAEEGRVLNTQPMDRWGAPSPVVLSDARILDVLIQNSDRHHGHFLWAQHWSRGEWDGQKGTWEGDMCPVFIDHAAGMRPEATVDIRHDNAYGTGPTEHISARTFLRLRCLDRNTLGHAMAGLLSPGEVDEIMRRRDALLVYFEHLVAERGHDQVVIMESEHSS